jgi:hypothetical protein
VNDLKSVDSGWGSARRDRILEAVKAARIAGVQNRDSG